MSPRIQADDAFSLERACEEILDTEQQIREAYPVSHPQHGFWVKLADLLNIEQGRARYGFDDDQLSHGAWTDFNRILDIARAWQGLRDEDRI
jgi:hypothetical protein